MTKRKDGPSAAAKLRVMKRDTFRCTYCGVSGNDAELQVDHIIPMSKGGSNHISNLTTACAKCNNTKNAAIGWSKASKSDEWRPEELIFVHIMKDGRIHNQGTVLEKHDDFWLIQRYSMLDGVETDIIAVKIDDIFNQEKVRMYSSEEQWKLAVIKEHARDGTLKGSIESNLKGQMQRWGF